MTKLKLKKQDHIAILKIVLIYSFFGGLWIYLSDSFVGLFTKDPELITQIAMFKGWAFITATAALLYLLIARRMRIVVQSEHRLQRSEERFKQIAENAEEIIWEINRNGLITYANPVLETVLGYRPDEIINILYVHDIVEPSLAEKIKSAIPAAFNEKKSFRRFNISFVHKTGKRVILEINAVPVLNSKGEAVFYRGANIDVTDRTNAENALRESEEKYRTLIQTSPDAILMLNLKGDILLVNEEAVIMHGYSSNEEMLKLNASCLITPEEVNHIYSNLDKVLSSKKSVYDEYVFVKKDGSSFYADLNLSVVFDVDNKPLAIIGVARNISERKNTELELEKYRLGLEDLVRERTKKLEELNLLLQDDILKQKEAEKMVTDSLEKEKELNVLKSEFISTASHEFRTPLAAILSSTELMERYWKKQDDQKFNEHAGRIKTAIRYLTGLLDDVLTVSRSETKKIYFNAERTDVIKLCTSIIEENKTLLNDNHHIETDIQLGNGFFPVDEKLLKLILNNLLSNAIKFSSDGGRIRLAAKTSGEEIVFEISDEGIGIPEWDKERIFEPFDRGSNIGVIRGTGLGMSIVKRSLDLHGGTIKMESGVDVGTKFIVAIPVIKNK
jgi:PAS domain S-box-containing protein